MVGITAIRRAILEGVQAANVEYEKWSCGWWVTDSGIEGHVVSTVARKLYSRVAGDGCVVMELAFEFIQEWSGAGRPRGRPLPNLKEGKRADIVILDKKERPIYVIEVKRLWDKKPCLVDLNRMRDLILKFGQEREGSLRRGLLTFLAVGRQTNGTTARLALADQVQGIGTVLEDEFDTKGLKLTCHQGSVRRYPKEYREQHGEPNWVHAAVCLELRSA
ncbi:MAG: hypothetical protein F4051_16870 [Boseongicola sp. SB0670_bin_30]|nr:hypothetical protein [Boseongicola sp. SB0670_bin_30]